MACELVTIDSKKNKIKWCMDSKIYLTLTLAPSDKVQHKHFSSFHQDPLVSECHNKQYMAGHLFLNHKKTLL